MYVKLFDYLTFPQTSLLWPTLFPLPAMKSIKRMLAYYGVTLYDSEARLDKAACRMAFQTEKGHNEQVPLEREKHREEHTKEIEELRDERDELRMGHQSEQNTARLDVTAGPARQRDQEAFQAEVFPQAAARETAVEGTQQPFRPTYPVHARSGPRKKPSRRRR
ncbi:hypothetical protein BCV69DRAFT_298934 [Microstroma glucosiphilum]|uniref:Uncharacterized protein n=1 Tax=Pseudomicrostroma glucosiphilum TaxID=1684307 RepID=A0A316U7D4_9BASI|nr:hypothetical protein BCV69DRAFT_298934 [Pseudomicrostroma glucosiphilum]PWN21156.1 hypothetical protein BCV69DRAFT_298934 [Pseudomicrostroma glucosiphilum]